MARPEGVKSPLGERLAQARRVLGVAMQQDMRQSEAAALIGVSRATWSRWESGDDEPSNENLARFARVCQQYGLNGITLGWINYGEGQGPPQIGKAPSKVPTKPKAVHHEKLIRPEDEARKKRNPRRA